MNEEIRSVIHFFYLQSTPPAEVAKKLEEVYRNDAVSRSAVYYWYKEFDSGRTSIKTLPRAGRPPQQDYVEAVDRIIHEHPYSSARSIATQLSLSPMTVTKILKEDLHMKKRLRRWVPKILTIEQKQMRTSISLRMLRYLENLTLKQRHAIVTCDESWFYLSYSHESKWCTEGEEPPISGKRLMNEEKVLIFTAFSISGIIMIHDLPENVTFNSTYMCDYILPQLTEIAQEVVRQKTKHCLVLHFDNAKPHTSKKTLNKINELGWRKLDHPPYSPDISPNDFFLYGYIKSKLVEYSPSSREELISAIKEICSEIPPKVWENVYMSWLRRLKAVHECGGEYSYIY